MQHATMTFKGIARHGAVAACIAMLATALLLAGAGTAQAGSLREAFGIEHSLDKAKGTQVAVYYQKPAVGYGGLYFQGDASNGNLKNVKLSNTKVAEAGPPMGDEDITVWPKKAGTTKLSYKWKGRKHVVTLKFVKYQNPVKSFKVGKKQYASKFKKNNVGLVKTGAGFTGKVTVTPAKNWTVTSITGYDENWGDYWGDVWVARAKLGKKGGKVKNVDCVRVVLKNKKTKAEQALLLCNYSLKEDLDTYCLA